MFSVEQRALNCIIFCKVCITETILPQFCKKYYGSTVPCKRTVYKIVENLHKRCSGMEGEKKLIVNEEKFQILALE